MNTELFIAQRFIKNQGGSKKHTTPIIKLSVVAIALSVAIMLISVAVVTGFKKEIRNRVIGFGGHIQINNYDSNNSLETSPINKNQEFIPEIKNLPGIKNIQGYATKPGLIKTKTDIQGITLKGIDKDFNWTFFEQNLIEGSSFEVVDSIKSDLVLLSTKIANMLNLEVGDEFATFFIDERPRVRRFKIAGLYQTSLEEFDKQVMLADIKHIRRLNEWDNNQIGGFEILIDNYDNIEHLTKLVRGLAEFRFMEDGSRLRVTNIREKYPQIFDWLGLVDMNVVFILVIMVIVAIINMVSGIIILILDRTKSIGLLKAIGATNIAVRKIFLYQALFLIGKGLIWGNVIAGLLLFLQDKYHLIKLDQASYFIDYAPVNIQPGLILIINLAALAVIFTFMMLPVLIVSRIEPVKTLRYN